MTGGFAIVDIVMLIFVAVIALSYAFRGFLKSAIQFFKTILAFVLAYFLGSRVGDFLCRQIFGKIVRNFVFERVNGLYEGSVDSLNVDAIVEKIPRFMMTEQVKAELSALEGSGDKLVNSITDSIATPTANVISTVVGYVGVFLVALLLLTLAACLLTRLIEKVSILKAVNTILGAVFGLLISFLILCVFSLV